MKAIANTTVISNFAAVHRLDLLRDLLAELHISTDVYGEIQDGQSEGVTRVEADGLLAQMIQAGFHSPTKTVTELL
jgi:predicted nucleic acid-binding protein